MKRTRQINIRLSEAEWEMLSIKSKERGVDLSTYMRNCSLEDKGNNNIYNTRVRKVLDKFDDAYLNIRVHSPKEMDEDVQNLRKIGIELWQCFQ